MKKRSAAFEAIAIMLLSMACFSGMNILIRLLSQEMHPIQMVALRNGFGLLIVVLWQMCLRHSLPRFPTQRLGKNFWRASIGFISMQLWFYSIAIMPVALATALSFTTPIFSTIFAILFLGEKAGWHRWTAIIAGLLGVMVILHPETTGIDGKAAFVLGASALMGIVGVMVKSLSRTEPPETIVFYMALFMTMWSIPLVIPYWHSVTPQQWGLAFAVALLSTAAHLLIARAYVRADMVTLMPFDFSRLIFTALMAHVLFGEILDRHTLAGSLIIVASTVYIAHREARRKKKSV